MTHIGEDISVIASFDRIYKIRPLKFKWSGRLFHIREVTYTWLIKIGQKNIYHFSVTDGASLYEISFDTTSLTWKLENIDT
jgi:hypothetical protein